MADLRTLRKSALTGWIIFGLMGLLFMPIPALTDDDADEMADEFLMAHNVAIMVKISKFGRIRLGTWGGTGSLAGDDDGCVWSSTNGYNLTAVGSGPGGSFVLEDGPNSLAYQVLWSDEAQDDQTMVANVPLVGQVTTAVRRRCQTNGNNAIVEIVIPEAVLAAAPAGDYDGDLTLNVAAE